MQDQSAELTEKELERVILKYGGRKADASAVKKWIYESSGHGSAMAAINAVLKKFFGLFSDNLRPDAIDGLTRVFNDAWNHFPHRSLGGNSPKQMLAEAAAKEPMPSPAPTMPKIICGGREMEWEEYAAMLREMERRQKPFKQWVKRSALPKYDRFLHRTLSASTADSYFEVADIFFGRVLHVGFLNLAAIRREFIQKEFPRWWTTHVLMDHKKPKEVLASLGRLFGFLEEEYGIDIVKFGF